MRWLAKRMHLECVCVFRVDQVCVVGIARADPDMLDDAIPPRSSYSPLTGWKASLPSTGWKGLLGFCESGGLNVTVIVPHYSGLRSGFTVRCGLLHQTAVINSLCQTQNYQLSVTTAQARHLPPGTVPTAFFTGFLHQL